MRFTSWIQSTSKAWGGAAGATVGAMGVGAALAEIFLWAVHKVPVMNDIPEAPVQIVMIALCGFVGSYFAPKNEPMPPKPPAIAPVTPPTTE